MYGETLKIFLNF